MKSMLFENLLTYVYVKPCFHYWSRYIYLILWRNNVSMNFFQTTLNKIISHGNINNSSLPQCLTTATFDFMLWHYFNCLLSSYVLYFKGYHQCLSIFKNPKELYKSNLFWRFFFKSEGELLEKFKKSRKKSP